VARPESHTPGYLTGVYHAPVYGSVEGVGRHRAGIRPYSVAELTTGRSLCTIVRTLLLGGHFVHFSAIPNAEAVGSLGKPGTARDLPSGRRTTRVGQRERTVAESKKGAVQVSTSNRGSDRSGAASPDAHSELKPPASPAPSLPTQPVVPDAPTVIRPSSSPGPVGKQMTVISGGVPSPITSSVPLSTNELGNLLEEEMLGPLRLDKFIGGGGMGAVFRAHDTP